MNAENNQKQEKIGIIGGGEIGTNLLKIFLNMDLIQVKYVADINLDSPGIVLAKENEINTTSDIMEVITDRNLNIILEVTGSEKVLKKIRDNKPPSTEVISGECAYFIFNIITEYKKFQSNLLTTVTEHLTEIYEKIEDNSSEVNNLLAEIEDVTDNLNMLAINASIEAAHAGKEGRGFSVVAEEVKNLALKSNNLVQDIEGINKDILDLNQRITEIVTELKAQNKT